jgi:hypothetical protein
VGGTARFRVPTSRTSERDAAQGAVLQYAASRSMLADGRCRSIASS